MRTRYESSRTMTIVRLWALVAIMIAALARPPAARADTTIHVNSDLDVVGNDGACTLREAITAANTNAASGNTMGECVAGTTGNDTIDFEPDYHTITLTNGMLPPIVSQVTIQGNGNGTLVVIQAALTENTAHDRVFEVKSGGDAELREVTVRYGVCDGTCADETYNGGGILVYDGSLTLYNSYVVWNDVNGAGSSLACGGGVYVAAAGTLDTQWTLVGDNTAPQGGGICSDGDVTIETNSAVNANDAVGYSAGHGYGGGILNHGTLTITDSSVSSNEAPINTPADTPNPTGAGGGIYNDSSSTALSIATSTISSNVATEGAGIYTGDGTLAISNSTLSSNTATTRGGAVEASSSAFGDAIVSIDASTLNSNSVTNGDGGAVAVGPGSATLINGTVQGNSASGDGGGMYAIGPSAAGTHLTALSSTFSDNTAGGNGGGVYAGTSTLALTNSILANSISTYDCYRDGATLGTDVHNLIESNYLCGAPVSTGDPVLGSLADNGGDTQTMALLAGSAAINAGDDTACAGAPVNAVDQRGVTRPYGEHCDIGAYEAQLPYRTAADFDGTGAANVVTYSGGAWQFYDFATGAYDGASSVWTGNPGGCIPAPMDYKGNGVVDFTQLCGEAWHFYNDDGSYNKGIWIGLPGAVPVPGDYNGDGTDDVVAFDGGAWQHFNFSTGLYDAASSVWTGLPGGAGTPAAMDYDGNGTADPTILEDSGAWHFYNDNGSYNKGIWIGIGGAIPVPGDYSDNGAEQPVVFDAGAWQFFDFATGAYDGASSVWTGEPAASGSGVVGPAPLDYDGDDMLDFTYYAGGAWHFFNADGGYNKGVWTGGAAGDEAISRRQLP